MAVFENTEIAAMHHTDTFHIPQFMTVKQVADCLGVSRQTVYNWIDARQLQAGRFPGHGHVRIRVADFHAFVDGMFPAPAAPANEGFQSPYTPENLRPLKSTNPAEVVALLNASKAASDKPEKAKPQKVVKIYRPDGSRDIAAEARQVARNRAAMGKPPLKVAG